jgi:hypothetical protein
MTGVGKKWIWQVWDAELIKLGQWILMGCVACAALPPFLGYVLLGLVVYVGLTSTEPTAKKLFSERNALQSKEWTGTITRKERRRLRKWRHDLRCPLSTRDLQIFWISWAVLILTLLYLALRLYRLPPSQWFF